MSDDRRAMTNDRASAFFPRRCRRAGFNLVEVVVAIGVVGVGIVAVLGTVAGLSGGSAYTADSVAAAALAQNLMAEIDTRPFDGSTPAPTGRVTNGLVAYYLLEDGSGTSASDGSRIVPLAPLHFFNEQFLEWIPGSNGLSIEPGGLLMNVDEAFKITTPCADSGQITIEVWFEPKSLETNESPIITCGKKKGDVNFVLTQEDEELNFYIRTVGTNNGGRPETTADIALKMEVTHCVATFDGNMALIFLNSMPVGGSDLPAGDLSGWQTLPLRIAHLPEADAHWAGKIFLVAVYSRALTIDEIRQNYAVGPSPSLLHNRAGYDGIDDYNGYADSPPTAEDGSAIPGAGQFSRTVEVVNVLTDNLDSKQNWDSTDAKRITVNVYKDYKLLATLVRARYRGVSSDDPPDPGY